MKYLIFRNKDFITMTAHDSVKDKVLSIEGDAWALSVTDEQYRDFGEDNNWELDDNNNITITREYENPGTVIISDPTEAQEFYKNYINSMKVHCENIKNSNPNIVPLISFLATIDTSAVTSITDTTNLTHTIYSLPGCPQVYRFETFAVDFLR